MSATPAAAAQVAAPAPTTSEPHQTVGQRPTRDECVADLIRYMARLRVLRNR